MSKKEWLSILTEEQRELRRQGRYDEINLTKEQREALGEEGTCWITSPSFYSNSFWAS